MIERILNGYFAEALGRPLAEGTAGRSQDDPP